MEQTELVGILNYTPDSFSDGGKYPTVETAVEHALLLQGQGAAIIDIGAESTRPGALPLTADQEWHRLEPLLEAYTTTCGVPFSLDTYHPKTVHRAAFHFGRFIVNDVTGMNNPNMIEAVVTHKLPCIISHLPGTHGQDIQAAHRDREHLIDDEAHVYDELLSKRAALMTAGISGEDITVDPGIGFGKTAELNRKLLSFARLVPNIDVMIGYSRKRFLGEDRMALAPNLAAGRIAIDAGARYLRVHDVAGHRQLLNKAA